MNYETELSLQSQIKEAKLVLEWKKLAHNNTAHPDIGYAMLFICKLYNKLNNLEEAVKYFNDSSKVFLHITESFEYIEYGSDRIHFNVLFKEFEAEEQSLRLKIQQNSSMNEETSTESNIKIKVSNNNPEVNVNSDCLPNMRTNSQLARPNTSTTNHTTVNNNDSSNFKVSVQLLETPHDTPMPITHLNFQDKTNETNYNLKIAGSYHASIETSNIYLNIKSETNNGDEQNVLRFKYLEGKTTKREAVQVPTSSPNNNANVPTKESKPIESAKPKVTTKNVKSMLKKMAIDKESGQSTNGVTVSSKESRPVKQAMKTVNAQTQASQPNSIHFEEIIRSTNKLVNFDVKNIRQQQREITKNCQFINSVPSSHKQSNEATNRIYPRSKSVPSKNNDESTIPPNTYEQIRNNSRNSSRRCIDRFFKRPLSSQTRWFKRTDEEDEVVNRTNKVNSNETTKVLPNNRNPSSAKKHQAPTKNPVPITNLDKK
jgi:hypothetical protein